MEQPGLLATVLSAVQAGSFGSGEVTKCTTSLQGLRYAQHNPVAGLSSTQYRLRSPAAPSVVDRRL